MKSMTGYGRSRIADEEHEIEVEIKSVNNRYLDLICKLPRELAFFESKLNSILNEKIKRGKIQVTIDVKKKKTIGLELSETNLLTYWELYNKAAKILNLKNDVSLSNLLSEPDVIKTESDNPEDPVFLNKIQKTFESALAEHQKMALQEGESMRKYFSESSQQMKVAIDRIKRGFPEYKKEIMAKMTQNIEHLLAEKLNEEALKRIMLEAAIYVEKSDVTEELVRLEDHLGKFRNKVVQNDKEAGKSLNFILQEMQREINTIGSKFNSVKVFDDIILIKEEIEKCREICQNVE